VHRGFLSQWRRGTTAKRDDKNPLGPGVRKILKLINRKEGLENDSPGKIKKILSAHRVKAKSDPRRADGQPRKKKETQCNLKKSPTPPRIQTRPLPGPFTPEKEMDNQSGTKRTRKMSRRDQLSLVSTKSQELLLGKKTKRKSSSLYHIGTGKSPAEDKNMDNSTKGEGMNWGEILQRRLITRQEGNGDVQPERRGRLPQPERLKS